MAAISSALAGSARKRCGVELGLEPALGDVGPLRRAAPCDMTRKPASSAPSRLPLATRRAAPALTSREAVGSQTIAASILPLSKPEVITSSGWLRYSFGFTPCSSNVACAMRSVQLPCGVATTLPSIHFTASAWSANCGRVLADEEHRALVAGQAEGADDPQVALRALARADDRRHVAHVADLLLAGEHLADDHRALEADLEARPSTPRAGASRQNSFSRSTRPDHDSV